MAEGSVVFDTVNNVGSNIVNQTSGTIVSTISEIYGRFLAISDLAVTSATSGGL